ncbi:MULTISPECIES: DNA mismatch repair endonuclease MutL [unclassified Psychrobacter]|uniref:DNA mismatch repair endonuclease MutL n=1 Tax=unclassified Psychrobacter TaxID=196806 RepID=UPI000EE9B1AC|nr:MULTISPECIES: DNA mismatch repair endonuclease MutL [unclassified Psychrobacter]HCI76966.1 ATPase [Psychrobacter sp.]
MPQIPDNHSYTRIKKLSPLLINQLAAGEVVTRPAAVVKELLENAIDAGATNIEIHITQGGMGMIEVVDNGVGIHPDDMVMAITRHATSKVADVANLHGITTLGFRGEALAATAAVSRLTLTSSHDDSGIGRQLQVAGVLDDAPKLMPVVHHRGTTITVKDLYFNVPARRGNLKSIATEFGHIETIVREVALARADVALTLFHDNKKRLSLSSNAMSLSTMSSATRLSNSKSLSAVSTNANGNNNGNPLPLSRLEQATGLSLTKKALEIAIDLTSLMQPSREYANNSFGDQASVNGWLWPITDSQDTLPKLIYVNGRLVKEALISNQLRQLAQTAQLVGIGYALYFDLPTQWLNINVHPSKQRIKISPINNIMAHVSHAIRTKLKTVVTTETIRSPNANANATIQILGNSQIVDSNLSIDNAFATVMPNTSTTIHSSKSHQVKSPKQPYQLSENRYSPQTLNIPSVSEKISQNTRGIANDVAIHSVSLPYCLDVVTHLNEALTKSVGTTYIENKALPWLLFYHQSQCVLIGAENWQSKMRSLFESSLLSNRAGKKDQWLHSANDINQQLAAVSMQMSKQDLMVFLGDVDALLTQHAIKAIDGNQLATLMLLSAPESRQL